MGKYRWKQTLFGFAGLGGIGWMVSALCTGEHSRPEEHPCRAIAGEAVRYLDIDGCPVAYVEEGEGDPAVVFLHGFGGRLESWLPVQHIVARRCRTVSLDLWGFGASGRPAAFAHRDWVRQVFGVLDALGIDRAVFASHSLGTRVSLLCAREQPERLQGLVVCDGDYGQTPHGYLLVWAIAHTPLLRLLLGRLRGNPGHIQRLIRMVAGADFDCNEDMVSQYYLPLCVQGTAQTWTEMACAPPLRGLRGLADGLRCPTLILWGEDDPVIPAHHAHPLAARLPGAECRLLPGLGHFPQEEDPELFGNHLLRFLTTHFPTVAAPMPDSGQSSGASFRS